jgi:hypothetical protein
MLMNRLKIQHGVSRIRRAKLQSSIDQTVADDIELMAEWSNNEMQYIINELLRFAIAQEEDFLKYKASLAANPARAASNTKSAPASIRSATDQVPKSDPSAATSTTHA